MNSDVPLRLIQVRVGRHLDEAGHGQHHAAAVKLASSATATK
jgi:hypothetical protein